MTETGRRAVRLQIDGRVQGVWFRGWTVDTATRLGLDGWVRNRSDGSVEVVAAGDPEAVDRLVAACHHGPGTAKVMAVAVTSTADPGPGGFRQVASL